MDTTLSASSFYRELKNDDCCFGDEEIGSVLDRIDSDHGAKIAFNEDGDFIGVLSSYKTVFKSQSSRRKKVQNALFQPMLITKDTALNQIAEYMASEKLYILPIFENDEVIGTVSAIDIVKRLLHDQNLKLATVEELIEDKPLILPIHATVNDVYPLLRTNGISEVIIVDKFNKVLGVVTRSDLKHAFIHPTGRQRFHKDNYRADDWSFDTEKRMREDDPVRNYLTVNVPVIHADKTNSEKLSLLIGSNNSFLVITDKASKPVGILSYRNVLLAMANLKPEDEINIVFEKPSSNVSNEEFTQALKDLNQFAKKLNQRTPIERVELRIQESKYATAQTAQYDVTIQIDPYSGRQIVAYGKAKIFRQSIKKALNQVENQFEKERRTKKSHRRKSLAESSAEVMEKRTFN